MSRLRGAAERRTGLSDWGDAQQFTEGFARLMASIEEDVRPHAAGRAMIRELCVRALANRLRFVEARRQAGALVEPPRAPIIIASMPRTGTTLLQRMLSADPAAMSLPLWLMLDPMPPPTAAQWRTGGWRRQRARLELQVLRRLIGDLDRKHHPAADEADECTYLFMLGGLSLQFYALWPVHSYAAWAVEQDARPAYRDYRVALQLYQRPREGAWWVLKSPMHFLALRELVETLPEARIIQLHRDPAVAVPSLHSLFSSMHGLVSRRYDRRAIAAMTTEVLAERADRVVALRAEAAADRFLDIQYVDLVADPVGTARTVYERFALSWTPEVERRIRTMAAQNPAERFGRHQYALDDYGLTRQAVEARFARYIERFGIRAER